MRIFKIKNNKIVFMTFDGAGYGDSPKYIANNLLLTEKKYELIWLTKDITDTSIPKTIRPVKFPSLQATYELATAKIWVKNNMNIFDWGKRPGQKYLQTWHGFGPKNDLAAEDSKTRIHKILRDLNSRVIASKIDCYLSRSPIQSSIFRNSAGHGYYKGEMLMIGSPRNDIFFHENKKLIENIRENLNLREKQKVLMYAPTYRNMLELPKTNLDYSLCIQSLQKKYGGEWIIFLRMHPALKEKISLPDNTMYDIRDVSSYPDIQELLLVTDILISDYSSITFDFALTRRQCILYVPDLEDYSNSDRSLHMSLETLPFRLAKSNHEVERQILMFNLEEYNREINEFIIKYNSAENGNATKKSIIWLGKQLGKDKI